MKKTILIFSALAVAGLFFSLYGWMQDMPINVEPKRLQDLVFYDHGDKKIQLPSFLGKPLVISSWASWCPLCIDGMPNFKKLEEEFGEKLEVILVNRGENLKIAAGSLEVLDPSDSFYKSIGGYQMPETIFVDKDGFIVMHKRGPMNFDELKRRAEDAFGL